MSHVARAGSVLGRPRRRKSVAADTSLIPRARNHPALGDGSKGYSTIRIRGLTCGVRGRWRLKRCRRCRTSFYSPTSLPPVERVLIPFAPVAIPLRSGGHFPRVRGEAVCRRLVEAERQQGCRPSPSGTVVTARATGFGGAASAGERPPTSRLTFVHAAGHGREGHRPHPAAPSQRYRRCHWLRDRPCSPQG